MAPWFSLPLHQGLGLPNPEWEQGIMAIKLFIKHANALHVENTLITASLEYTQLQIGSSLPVFNTKFSKWGFLAESTWLTLIWEFVSTHWIQLHPSSNYVPEPPPHNDHFLMDIAMESGLSPTELGAINHCHLAHQALFLSNLTTGWGDWICPNLLVSPKEPIQSCWQWPLEQPEKAYWSIWVKFLQHSVAMTDIHLIHCLGPWLDMPHCCTAVLWGHSNYWTTYCGIAQPSQGTHTLQRCGTATILPEGLAYACILSLRHGIMILHSFAPIAPRHVPLAEYIEFDFHGWVKYWDPHARQSGEQLGKWLDMAKNQGPAMVYWILKDNGYVISRSTVRPLNNEEWLDENEKKAREEFDQAEYESLGKFDESLEAPNDELEEPICGEMMMMKIQE